MLYYLINKYKLNKGLVLNLSLKALLSIPNSLTKEVKYFYFFREEIIIINTELSLYLDPPIFKNRVYPVK